MAFVLGLPQIQQGIGSAFVMLDRFLNIENFIPCKKTPDASHVANLYFQNMVHLHGLPKTIILFYFIKTSLWYNFGEPHVGWGPNFQSIQHITQTEVVTVTLGYPVRSLVGNRPRQRNFMPLQEELAYNSSHNRHTQITLLRLRVGPIPPMLWILYQSKGSKG